MSGTYSATAGPCPHEVRPVRSAFHLIPRVLDARDGDQQHLLRERQRKPVERHQRDGRIAARQIADGELDVAEIERGAGDLSGGDAQRRCVDREGRRGGRGVPEDLARGFIPAGSLRGRRALRRRNDLQPARREERRRQPRGRPELGQRPFADERRILFGGRRQCQPGDGRRGRHQPLAKRQRRDRQEAERGRVAGQVEEAEQVVGVPARREIEVGVGVDGVPVLRGGDGGVHRQRLAGVVVGGGDVVLADRERFAADAVDGERAERAAVGRRDLRRVVDVKAELAPAGGEVGVLPVGVHVDEVRLGELAAQPLEPAVARLRVDQQRLQPQLLADERRQRVRRGPIGVGQEAQEVLARGRAALAVHERDRRLLRWSRRRRASPAARRRSATGRRSRRRPARCAG